MAALRRRFTLKQFWIVLFTLLFGGMLLFNTVMYNLVHERQQALAKSAVKTAMDVMSYQFSLYVDSSGNNTLYELIDAKSALYPMFETIALVRDGEVVFSSGRVLNGRKLADLDTVALEKFYLQPSKRFDQMMLQNLSFSQI